MPRWIAYGGAELPDRLDVLLPALHDASLATRLANDLATMARERDEPGANNVLMYGVTQDWVRDELTARLTAVRQRLAPLVEENFLPAVGVVRMAEWSVGIYARNDMRLAAAVSPDRVPDRRTNRRMNPMATPSDLGAPVREFDHHSDPAIRVDPFTAFDRFRDERVFWTPELDGFWVLTRHADIRAVLRDTDAFSSRNTSIPAAGWPRPLMPVELDPPDHGPFRALLARCLNGRAGRRDRHRRRAGERPPGRAPRPGRAVRPRAGLRAPAAERAVRGHLRRAGGGDAGVRAVGGRPAPGLRPGAARRGGRRTSWPTWRGPSASARTACGRATAAGCSTCSPTRRSTACR